MTWFDAMVAAAVGVVAQLLTKGITGLFTRRRESSKALNASRVDLLSKIRRDLSEVEVARLQIYASLRFARDYGEARGEFVEIARRINADYPALMIELQQGGGIIPNSILTPTVDWLGGLGRHSGEVARAFSDGVPEPIVVVALVEEAEQLQSDFAEVYGLLSDSYRDAH